MRVRGLAVRGSEGPPMTRTPSEASPRVAAVARSIAQGRTRDWREGASMRATVPRLESITSIRPGPWWLKPLWSLRQHVDVSRMFSEAILSRQGSLPASSSHLACCTSMEAATIANDS